MDFVVKETSIMPHMIHLTTHRLVSIFHYASGRENLFSIAITASEIIRKRGFDPWELQMEYHMWHDRNWFYKTLLGFLKPNFMKDDNVLSPEALEIERKLAQKRSK